jgi:hypothetical protein
MRTLSTPLFVVAAALAAVACTQAPDATRTSALAAPTAASITTDATTYAPGQNVRITWDGLPGNVHDWVAIAPLGTDTAHVTAWMYTGGAASGASTFYGPSETGTYIARAFLDDGYSVLAESATFTVAPATGATVTADATDFRVGQAIGVHWSGLPGNPHDWIAIAPAGSSTQTVSTWAYTGGAATGAVTLPGLRIAGSYVARAFVDDSYAMLGESAPFTVATAIVSITTDQAAYLAVPDSVVTMSWAGLPGGATDWIAIAPQGSLPQNVLTWKYMGGLAAGSTTLPLPATFGTYVVRTFANDSYELIGESAPFGFTTSISTDHASYVQNLPITASWGVLPQGGAFKIALAPAGSPSTSTVSPAIAVTTSGSHMFGGLAADGSFVARVLDTTVTPPAIFAETAPFTVAGTQTLVTTSAPSYHVGDDIDIHWLNMPGNATDWVGFAPVGSPDTTVVNWAYLHGAPSGVALVRGSPTAGTFVARAFTADSYNKVAESAPFLIQ